MAVPDARPGRADHLGQGFLADVGNDRLRAALLAEIRQKKQKPRQPLFAGIEPLVDQILFNPAVAGRQIGHEHLGKFRLIVEYREHRCLRNSGDQTFFQRGRRRDADRMSVHAAFAKELAGSKNPDHLFALFRYDNDLDPATLNIKDGVCHVPLGEDDLILVKFKYGFPPPPLWRETPWDQMQPDWHRSSLYELVPQPAHLTILAKKHPKQKCRATRDFASIEERGNLACGNEAPSRASTGSMASRHLVILGSQKAVPVWSILTTVLY